MRTNLTILITFLLFVSCERTKETTVQKKPTNVVVGLKDLTFMLANEIDYIVAENYLNLGQKSHDSISGTLENIGYKLYKLKEKADSISQRITNQAIIKSNKLSKYPAVADTQLYYSYVLNNFEPYFPKNFISDASTRNNFNKLIKCQLDVIEIRQQIVKNQKGKGKIYCREVGEKIIESELNSVTDYWDLFNLVERIRYTLFKEILCTFTNLKYYNKEIKYKSSLHYDDTLTDISKWTEKNNNR